MCHVSAGTPVSQLNTRCGCGCGCPVMLPVEEEIRVWKNTKKFSGISLK